MLKGALAAICVLTLSATAFLTLSLIVLRPPRANFAAWSLMAGLFGAESVLSVVALAWGLSALANWLRYTLLAGAAAVAIAGAWWVNATLSDSHFEGSALVLGSMLVAQGALTLWILRPARSKGLA